MVIGKQYTKFKKSGERTKFSFGEEFGVFLGILPSGFFRFKLSGTRECMVNPDTCLFRERDDKLQGVVTEAQKAFWRVVAKKYPDITTGDLPPDITAVFDVACEEVVRIWTEGNKRKEVG